jgi:ATP-dependent RNA helicase DeaD
MNEFKKLGVSEAILKSLEEAEISVPTEIQEKSIPLILEGKDVIAGSATGSGKTLAFGAGIIQNNKPGNGIQSLVLTPTRELAEQVKDALRKFSKHSKLKICVVYGGVSINPQIEKLRQADVVVGTPGRILDHLERQTLNLSKVNLLVLDEADRMLDMGFIDDVQKITSQCPKERQTLLFSATIQSHVVSISQRYMNNPVKISAESYVDPKKLTQVYYDTPRNVKVGLLVHLLKHEESGLVMVFCNTRRNVDFITTNLKANGVEVQAIHGGFSQAKRTKTLSDFHSNKAQVLVCTDVAARGLDIPHVSHVYNYDMPDDGKEYVHRIGRTARAGKEGKVINVLSEEGYDNFSRILHEIKIDIPKVELPKTERVIIKKVEEKYARNGSGRGGPRGGSRGGGRPMRRWGVQLNEGRSEGRSSDRPSGSHRASTHTRPKRNGPRRSHD